MLTDKNTQNFLSIISLPVFGTPTTGNPRAPVPTPHSQDGSWELESLLVAATGIAAPWRGVPATVARTNKHRTTQAGVCAAGTPFFACRRLNCVLALENSQFDLDVLRAADGVTQITQPRMWRRASRLRLALDEYRAHGPLSRRFGRRAGQKSTQKAVSAAKSNKNASFAANFTQAPAPAFAPAPAPPSVPNSAAASASGFVPIPAPPFINLSSLNYESTSQSSPMIETLSPRFSPLSHYLTNDPWTLNILF